MKKLFYFSSMLLLAAALTWGGSGCYYDNFQELHPELLLVDNGCDTTSTISYQAHIVPIMNNSCGANNSCHNSSGAGGGIVLQNYAGVKASASTGQLLSAITWNGNASQMPKNSSSKIDDCSIAQISKWIAAGAPDN